MPEEDHKLSLSKAGLGASEKRWI